MAAAAGGEGGGLPVPVGTPQDTHVLLCCCWHIWAPSSTHTPGQGSLQASMHACMSAHYLNLQRQSSAWVLTVLLHMPMLLPAFAVAGMSKFLPGRSASAVRQAVNVKLIQEGRLNEVHAR